MLAQLFAVDNEATLEKQLKFLEKYYESITDIEDDYEFYKVLERWLADRKENLLSPGYYLSLVAMKNNIKDRILQNQLRFDLQEYDSSTESLLVSRKGEIIRSKTFSKKSLRNKLFRCKIVSGGEVGQSVDLTIRRMTKGSTQSVHCVYFADLKTADKKFSVVVKFAHCEVPKYNSGHAGSRKNLRKYKFMSDQKIAALQDNYVLLTRYLVDYHSTKSESDPTINPVARIVEWEPRQAHRFLASMLTPFFKVDQRGMVNTVLPCCPSVGLSN